MKTPTIQDWLWVEVMFIQAMIGAISSNFRQIVLSYKNSEWILIVILEKDSDEDREEIADIVEEFSIYLEDIKNQISDVAYVNARAVISITSNKLDSKISKNERVIFRRKEL
jgi:hypothetical protein